jgi:hypothetical protein
MKKKTPFFLLLHLSDRTDSCSSTSLSIEINKKHITINPATPTKPNGPLHRTNTTTKCSNDKTKNGSLRESLDELNRLSHRMDNGIDQEHNR